jgi:hypothetical protein
MPYHPSPTSAEATEAVLDAARKLSGRDRRDARFRTRMLAAQVKARSARRGHKVQFSERMAIETLGKVCLLLLKRGAV